MKIITLSHQKGGVGKSTLSMNLAISLALQNKKVALLDFDNQQTTYKIISNLKYIDVYNSDMEIKEEYDMLVVDTPPYIDARLKEIYNQSDLIIVPFTVSPLDIIHAQATIDLIKKMQYKNNKIICRLLVNQYGFNTSLIDNLKDEINSLQVTLFNTFIQNRISFIRSIIGDKGIFSTSDIKAKEQINNLTKEILNILK